MQLTSIAKRGPEICTTLPTVRRQAAVTYAAIGGKHRVVRATFCNRAGDQEVIRGPRRCRARWKRELAFLPEWRLSPARRFFALGLSRWPRASDRCSQASFHRKIKPWRAGGAARSPCDAEISATPGAYRGCRTSGYPAGKHKTRAP